MEISRREAVKLLGVSAASTFIGASPLFAQSSATGPPRMPLDEFVQDAQLLAALRKGVLAMKRRQPSDPLSWFYQAAIHGVTDDAVKKAAAQDPKVDAVFKKRYWNQCPHDGENSANFLPWHRAYTYHFEKILRMHTEEVDFPCPIGTTLTTRTGNSLGNSGSNILTATLIMRARTTSILCI